MDSKQAGRSQSESPRFTASCTKFALLDDDQLFVAAKWFQRRRDELRREFTMRGCGSRVTVYCDTPPLERLNTLERNELARALTSILEKIEDSKATQ